MSREDNNDEIDYSDENPNKILDIYSLIEVIEETFNPTSDHNPEYLNKRLELLCNLFEFSLEPSDSKNDDVYQLLQGHGNLPTLRILPFDGAHEVTDSLTTEAHQEIYKQFDSEISDLQRSHRLIQRAYITYLVLHAVKPRLRSKTTTLQSMFELGLPESDPGSDPTDY